MTIHSAPIPPLKALWQALFSGLSKAEPWRLSPEKSVQFYSRGMWAMAEGVRFILDKRGKKEGKVWLPDYFCNEPLAFLRKKELNLHFYPIKEDLSPDWDRMEDDAARCGPPDVFILVHYFGFINLIEKAGTFCDKHGAELLEDGAHLLLPINGVGRNVSIFSPRKLLAIPEGGLLMLPEGMKGRKNNKECAGDRKVVWKWLARRLTQRMMMLLRISWHQFRKEAVRTEEEIVQSRSVGYSSKSINLFTLKLLAVLEKEFELVVEKRRKNYARLSLAINGIKGVRPLFSSIPDQVCPYAFPLIISDKKREVALQLQNKGIPASSWPDLPPEVLKARAEYKTAVWLQEHILLLPVHQDLSDRQVEYMVFKLREILEKGK
jgi:dTDP-4-amino-4,6-dideoxygalactose transaminase